MVSTPQPDIVPPGWQLQLIDVLAHGDGGMEPTARASGGAPREGQNTLLHIASRILTTPSMVLASDEGSAVGMQVVLHRHQRKWVMSDALMLGRRCCPKLHVQYATVWLLTWGAQSHKHIPHFLSYLDTVTLTRKTYLL